MDRIRRFGAFRNPDFYRSQAMRLPVYNKPRIIDSSAETAQQLILGRGCQADVTNLLTELHVPFTVEDKRCTGQPISVHFNGTLRPEQQPAADALLAQEIGVLSATTAFGKTVVGSYLIAKRKVNTLILVHSGALLQQWKAALEQFLVFDGSLPVSDADSAPKRGRKRKPAWIGQLGSGKNTLGGRVDIATMQSLVEKPDAADLDNSAVKPLVRDYGMVICDECHHVSAFSFEAVLKAVRARYVYGLTATPIRQDGHQPIIFMQCEPILYRVDARQQLEKQNFTHTILPRFTTARMTASPQPAVQEVLSALCENEARNRLIVADALAAVQQGRTPIVLTGRTKHANALAALLQKESSGVFLLTGEGTAKEKRELLAALHDVPPNAPMVLVATGKYVGEGFDEPRLDTLLLALPISWKGTLAQYAGRLHRSYAGKQSVQIYDYVDLHIPMLDRMYHKRLHGYAELGYTVQSGKADAADNLIFDRKTFYSRFSDDVFRAEHSILLAAPFLQPACADSFLHLLSQGATEANRALPTVTLLTRPAAEYAAAQQGEISQCIAQLEIAGCDVCLCPRMQYHFAVFESRTTWYGNLNFLSFIGSDESTLRVENAEISQQLQEFAAELAPAVGQPWHRLGQ